MEGEHIEQPSLPAGTRVLQSFVLGPLQESTVHWSVHLGWAAKAGTNRVRVMVLREPLTPPAIEAIESRVHRLHALFHPNLAPLVACGIEHGILVAVEPEVVGSTLRDRLLRASGRRLPTWETARIVYQSARALAFLASRPEPIAHEGLDPESIYLAFPQRDVRIVRPGLAQVLRTAGIANSRAPRASYAAPEQFAARGPISPAVDQFVLASIAFECLTGGPAFPASASGVEAMLRGARPRLSAGLGPHADSLTTVLHRAWSARPEDRYPDALEFAREFATAAGTSLSRLNAAPMRAESRRSSPPGAPVEGRRNTRPSLRRALARRASSPPPPPEPECVELAPWELESVPAAEARQATGAAAPPDAKRPVIVARSARKQLRRRLLAKIAHRTPAATHESVPPSPIVPLAVDATARPITLPPIDFVSLAPASRPSIDGAMRPVTLPPEDFAAATAASRRAPSRVATVLGAATVVFVAAVAIAIETRGERRATEPSFSTGSSLSSASAARALHALPSAPSTSDATPVPTRIDVSRPADARVLHDGLQRAVDACSARFGRLGRHVHATVRYGSADGTPVNVRVWGPPLRNDFQDCVATAARTTRAPASVSGDWEHDFRLRSF